VSGFIVTSVSAFAERLFLCYVEKFTSVSLRRILKFVAVYQKGRRNDFFPPILILFWKDTEGLKEPRKQVMEGKWSF
jgi:hypothetical protein